MALPYSAEQKNKLIEGLTNILVLLENANKEHEKKQFATQCDEIIKLIEQTNQNNQFGNRQNIHTDVRNVECQRVQSDTINKRRQSQRSKLGRHRYSPIK